MQISGTNFIYRESPEKEQLNKFQLNILTTMRSTKNTKTPIQWDIYQFKKKMNKNWCQCDWFTIIFTFEKILWSRSNERK